MQITLHEKAQGRGEGQSSSSSISKVEIIIKKNSWSISLLLLFFLLLSFKNDNQFLPFNHPSERGDTRNFARPVVWETPHPQHNPFLAIPFWEHPHQLFKGQARKYVSSDFWPISNMIKQKSPVKSQTSF